MNLSLLEGGYHLGRRRVPFSSAILVCLFICLYQAMSMWQLQHNKIHNTKTELRLFVANLSPLTFVTRSSHYDEFSKQLMNVINQGEADLQKTREAEEKLEVKSLKSTASSVP